MVYVNLFPNKVMLVRFSLEVTFMARSSQESIGRNQE